MCVCVTHTHREKRETHTDRQKRETHRQIDTDAERERYGQRQWEREIERDTGRESEKRQLTRAEKTERTQKRRLHLVHADGVQVAGQGQQTLLEREERGRGRHRPAPQLPEPPALHVESFRAQHDEH